MAKTTNRLTTVGAKASIDAYGTTNLFLHEPRCGSNREDRDACGAGRSRDYDAKPYKEASPRFDRNPYGTGLGGRTAALCPLSRRITLDCEPRLAFHPTKPPSRPRGNRLAVPYVYGYGAHVVLADGCIVGDIDNTVPVTVGAYVSWYVNHAGLGNLRWFRAWNGF